MGEHWGDGKAKLGDSKPGESHALLWEADTMPELARSSSQLLSK